MSRRSSRITRSTRKRPREIEEDTPDEVTGQEDNSEEIIQEQKNLEKDETEKESKESSSPMDWLLLKEQPKNLVMMVWMLMQPQLLVMVWMLLQRYQP